MTVSARGGEMLTLVADSQSQATIIVPDDAPGSVRFAAQELQHYLHQSTGAMLPIQAEAQDANATSIYLGNSPQARDAGFTAEGLVADGSIRGVQGNRLFILGRDTDSTHASWDRDIPAGQALYEEHGTLYGVYSFLEEVLGVHWYAPGAIGQVVPAHKNVAIPVATTRDEPAFTDRTFYPSDILYYHQKDPRSFPDTPTYVSNTRDMYLWLMRLRWGTQAQVRGSHSVAFWDYAKRFGKDHPDWFALQSNGQRAINISRGAYLCWSHPDLIKELTQDAIAQIAKALQKEVPGANVATLAYAPKLLPPKTTTLPDNVIVRLCVSGANASYDPPAHITQLKLNGIWIRT